MKVTIKETSYKPYQGMTVSYDTTIVQKESDFKLTAEKTKVNETPLSSSEKVLLKGEGSIHGKALFLKYVLLGSKRHSSGHMNLTVNKKNYISGTFKGTAANSSGEVEFTRIPNTKEEH